MATSSACARSATGTTCLLIRDEVICSWGRLGHYFGHERFGYSPDIVTTAKGMTSAYAAMGAVITTDKVAEPFMHGESTFIHGITFGGHPISSAVALANIEIFEREDLCGHVPEHEPEFRGMLEGLRDLPIVGDVRGAGYFHAIELVKDRETRESFNDEECEVLLRGFLSNALFDAGPDLSRGRSRRPSDPALTAADRRAGTVRGDRRHLAQRADGGVGQGCRRLTHSMATSVR